MFKNKDRSAFYKPAMLAFLLLTVGLAWLVVTARRSTDYTGPVKLDGLGVSVSIPAGAQWHRPTAGWAYKKNTFSLVSVLRISEGELLTAQWQYCFLPDSNDVKQLIDKEAASISGAVTNQDTHNIGDTAVHTAVIVSKLKAIQMHYAVMQTLSRHTLTLEVAQQGGPDGMASDIFQTLIGSIKYSEPEALSNGIKFVENFKSSLLKQLPLKRQGPRYYLLKGSDGDIIGFMVGGVKITPSADANYPIAAADIYYMDSPKSTFAEQSLFRANENLTAFEWVSRQSSPRSGRKVTIKNRLDPNGLMSVDVLNRIKIGDFYPSGLAVPDILSDFLSAGAADSNVTSIFTDIVLSDATVIPTLISIEPTPAQTGYKYIVSAKFYDDSGRSQKMYIDASGEVIRTEVSGETNYTLEAASANDVLVRFGQWDRQINQVQDYLMIK